MTASDGVAVSEFELTPEQELIASHPADQHGIVIAGPGTGKSAALVALVDRLWTDMIPTRLVTFTRAATAELARRVSGLPSQLAQRPSTIHSFRNFDIAEEPKSDYYTYPDGQEPVRVLDADWNEQMMRVLFTRQIRYRFNALSKTDDGLTSVEVLGGLAFG